MAYLWFWYLDVRQVDQLTYSELKAWCDIRKVTLEIWETDVIKTLDRICWRTLNG